MGAIYMISMVIGNPQKSEQTDLHSNNVEHVHQSVTLLAGIKSNLQVFQVMLQSFNTTLEAVPSVDHGGRRPGYWGPSIEFPEFACHLRVPRRSRAMIRSRAE